MNTYWFEQKSEDVPSDQSWLSAAEVDRSRTLRFPKRRTEWLLGRWTAKNALAVFLEVPADFSGLRQIEIHAAASGSPEVYFENESANVEISLSHRGSVGACAIAPRGTLLGCDLELVEPHGQAFTTDYFDAEEQALISRCCPMNRSLVVALLWSAKESALKALKEGLRLDTRLVHVAFSGELPSHSTDKAIHESCAPSELTRNDWARLEVHYQHGHTFNGWWIERGALIRTLLAAPPPDAPIVLFNNKTTTVANPQ